MALATLYRNLMPTDQRVRTYHRITANRRLWRIYFLARPHLRSSVPNVNSGLVVDGFPRSANSYTQVMLADSLGPQVRLAGHTHSPQTLLHAVKLGIPAILLLRHPDDACASFVQGESGLRPDTAFRLYTNFHKPLISSLSSILVLTFEQVTTDWQGTSNRICSRFGMEFVNAPLDQGEAFTRIEGRLPGEGASSGRNELQVSRPSAQRDAGLSARIQSLVPSNIRNEALESFELVAASSTE